MASEKNMGGFSRKLNLEMGSSSTNFVPITISEILNEISLIHDFSSKLSKLDFHVHLLEEELRKIDAFRRELPYCMQILQDAIEALKKERLRLRELEEVPILVTEELVPLQSDTGSHDKNELNVKKAWMSRVRLWNAPVQFHSGADETLPFQSPSGEAPLKRSFGALREKRKDPIEELSLKVAVEPVGLDANHEKKRRRCWSTDLHCRFVNTLRSLGGAYEATPKQIRDEMKVEGLTNDEVKSHLQKFRLHLKKNHPNVSFLGSPKAHHLDEGCSAGRGGADKNEGDKAELHD